MEANQNAQVPKAKCINVIDSRINIDNITVSEHANHKVALEEAKKLKLKDEFKDRDIIDYGDKKKEMNYTPAVYKYRTQDGSTLHVGKNLTQGKVKKVRTPKGPKLPKVETVDELEARIKALKEAMGQ